MQAAAAAAVAMQGANVGPNAIVGQPIAAPPLYCATAPPPLGDVLQRRTPASEQHLQYNSPHSIGRALYTMTCEFLELLISSDSGPRPELLIILKNILFI